MHVVWFRNLHTNVVRAILEILRSLPNQVLLFDLEQLRTASTIGAIWTLREDDCQVRKGEASHVLVVLNSF